MVRLGKTGGGYKSTYISGTVCLIYFKLGQCIHEGMPLPLGGVIFMVLTSQGVYGCTKHIQDGFLAEKQGKIQPGVFLVCPPVV